MLISVGIFIDSLFRGPKSVAKYVRNLIKAYSISSQRIEPVFLIRSSKLLGKKKKLNVLNSFLKGENNRRPIKELDVIHIPDCGRPLPPIDLLKKIRKFSTPIVVTNHGMVHTILPPNFVYNKIFSTTFLLDRKHLLEWRIAKKFIDIIITPSSSEKQVVSKALGITSERIIPIYHGVDHNLYKPLPISRAFDFLERHYNINQPYIFHISSYQPKKNVERLISAYALLKKKFGIKEKLVIGGLQPKEKLLRLAIRLGLNPNDVTFTGYIPEEHLPYFYNATRVFVFPSLHESFGMPILEAMACGAPVVTSNVFACPEVAGDAALLVDPFNVKEIAMAILRVLRDKGLRRELVKRSLKRAKQYTWEEAAFMHLKVYRVAAGY